MTEIKKVVGRYELERIVGEGGFGIVYQARDRVLDRPVALKLLKPDLSSSSTHIDRFTRESRTLGALNHPNIIRILDVIEDEGRYFLVMDYMPGGSLADRLADGCPIPVEQAMVILQPITKAIDYAHRKQLVHRDIKPSNILFTESGEPVLSDFGLVKSLAAEGISSTRSAFGTPEYMAPEQVLGRELTPAADIYAFGVVAYQMLTGEVPFSGATPYEIQDGHVRGETPDIHNRNQQLPELFTEIFKKVLSKDPAGRYASAGAFITEIENVTTVTAQDTREADLVRVQEHWRAHDYAAAAALLERLLVLRPDEELHKLLTESREREKLWQEHQRITEEWQRVSRRVKEIEEEDGRLFQQEQSPAPAPLREIKREGDGQSNSSKRQRGLMAFWQEVVFGLAMLVGLAGQLLLFDLVLLPISHFDEIFLLYGIVFYMSASIVLMQKYQGRDFPSKFRNWLLGLEILVAFTGIAIFVLEAYWWGEFFVPSIITSGGLLITSVFLMWMRKKHSSTFTWSKYLLWMSGLLLISTGLPYIVFALLNIDYIFDDLFALLIMSLGSLLTGIFTITSLKNDRRYPDKVLLMTKLLGFLILINGIGIFTSLRGYTTYLIGMIPLIILGIAFLFLLVWKKGVAVKPSFYVLLTGVSLAIVGFFNTYVFSFAFNYEYLLLVASIVIGVTGLLFILFRKKLVSDG